MNLDIEFLMKYVVVGVFLQNKRSEVMVGVPVYSDFLLVSSIILEILSTEKR